ncbi:MAG: hypothetical protein DRN27_04955 [Thermoplasmata archaeon]|nr:MAG: hypothetical protein DRN27_04955 [Thermoplasmata archaeon]
MQKDIFEKHKELTIKLILKPNNFALTGIIEDVFEDCFQFKTTQKTEYITFDKVEYLTLIKSR